MSDDAGAGPSRSELEALGALARGEQVDPGLLAALEQRELIAEGQLIEESLPFARAIGEPLALVDVNVRRGQTILAGSGWLGEEQALVPFPRDDDADSPCDVVMSELNLFTATLARFLELGPRAEAPPAGASMLGRDALERLTGALGPIDRASAEALWSVPGHPECIEALTGPGVVHWRVQLSDPADPDEQLVCEVIDCGRPGMWVVAELPGPDNQVALLASTPSHVWRLLSSLLADEPGAPWPEIGLPDEAYLFAG